MNSRVGRVLRKLRSMYILEGWQLRRQNMVLCTYQGLEYLPESTNEILASRSLSHIRESVSYFNIEVETSFIG